MKKNKYRVWNKKDKCFERTTSLECDGEGNLCIWYDNFGTEKYTDSDFVIQSFVNLLDKNGVEIFEGDIVYCEVPESTAYICTYANKQKLKIEYGTPDGGLYFIAIKLNPTDHDEGIKLNVRMSEYFTVVGHIF